MTTRSQGAPRWSRRDVLRAALGSAALVGGGGGTAATALAGKGGGGGVGSTGRNPLFIPPVASVEDFGLTAAPATVDLGGGQVSSAIAYNGSVPGPTFVARAGDDVRIGLTNWLEQPTTIHWHGMVVPRDMDGHPRDAIPPGHGYVYYYPIRQRAGLNWYHPHPHMLTGQQVNLGLAGAFLIRDEEEDALGLPAGDHEVPLILRDANLDDAGNLLYNPRMTGFVGSFPLVNGTRDAGLAVDTGLYRLRVLNGANTRVFRLALSTGAPFTVIGNDGGLLETASQVDQIPIGPAERLDLLVDFSGRAAGERVILQCLDTEWDLVEFLVAGEAGGSATPPRGPLSTIERLGDPAATREFRFESMDRINGQVYDMHRIDFQVPFGQTELWRFTSVTLPPHPVHVHGASFQVQSRVGGRADQVFPWERGWKDTVLLRDGETVDVLIRFDNYRGVYLLHCHNLEHEDMGMVMNFEVV